MPDQSEEWRADAGQTGEEHEHEHEEGGPVKSFLEHLEDLRWVLIRCLVALGVAFIVCLVAANWVVKAINYPLSKAKVHFKAENQVVTMLFGTNRIGLYQFRKDISPVKELGTNQFVNLHLEPITIGTNVVLGVRLDFDPTEAERFVVPIANTGPANSFFVAVQVALYGGGLLASPLILYFVASFVFPALKMTEKKYVFRGLGYGLGLFFAGVTFCYLGLMPIALSASVRYADWLGFTSMFWRAEDYIGFVCKFMLGMGLGFEMPVILLVLVKIGILNYSMLARARKYVIVASFFLGAVLTTPEIITQVLMAFPLMLLYEITIWIAWFWERQDKKREVAAGLMKGA